MSLLNRDLYCLSLFFIPFLAIPASMSQSPRTPTIPSSFLMAHKIHHRFSGKQLLVSIACGYCDRVMLFGLKCKECGYVCVTLTLDRGEGYNSITTNLPENIL